MKTNPLISVIIPAYNIEKYIGECLDSIVNQTYKNLEILVVNDGSKDNTAQVIEEYASKDNRVKHLLKENSGVSDTRNYGLDRAKGNLISFVDGDDFIDPDMYECLVSEFEKNPDVDIIKFDCNVFFDKKEFNNQHNIDKLRIGSYNKVSKNKAIELFASGSLGVGAPWGSIYKNNVLEKARFVKNKYYEDGPFSFESLFYCRNVLLSSLKFYNYRKNREGSTTFQFTEKLFDENDILESMLLKYKDNTYYTQAIKNYSIEQLMHLYSDVSASTQKNKNVLLKRAAEIVKTRRGTELMTKEPMKRFRYKLFLFSPKLFGVFNFIMRKIKRR